MLTTVLRAGRVLALFDAARPERSLSEVADVLGLPRSTVHALLKTLCATGLLRRTASRRYALGSRLQLFSARLLAAEPSLATARGAAEELARSWGAVVRVVVADRWWGPVTVVEAVAPPAGWAGGGAHRCLAVAAALATGGAPEHGCWCDMEVSRPGWCCLAAVVRNSGGGLLLDVSLPAGRFYRDLRRLRDSLLSACGYRGAPRVSPAERPDGLRYSQLAR